MATEAKRQRETGKRYPVGFEKWRMGPWAKEHMCSLETVKGKQTDSPPQPADPF